MDQHVSSAPQNTHIEVRIRPLFLTGLILIYIIWLGLGIFSLVGYEFRQPNSGSVMSFRLIGLQLISMVIYFLFFISRVPWKVQLVGDTLTTLSPRGKKAVSMSNVVKAQAVSTIPTARSGYVPPGGLKLTDAKGNVIFLALGWISRRERAVFYEPLLHCLGQPQVKGDENEVEIVINRWFAFLPKQ